MKGNRTRGSELVSANPDTGKLNPRIPDPISFYRTAVLVWLLALLVLPSAWGADTAPVRGITGLHVSSATDTCNAQAERLFERPHVPDAEVGRFHIRRVVVDDSPDTGCQNESGEEPATWG